MGQGEAKTAEKQNGIPICDPVATYAALRKPVSRVNHKCMNQPANERTYTSHKEKCQAPPRNTPKIVASHDSSWRATSNGSNWPY
jgi:hypothetical protein